MKPKHPLRTIFILAVSIATIILLESARQTPILTSAENLQATCPEANASEATINDFILYNSVIKYLSISVIK